ncbi:Glycosyltransferase involved in cell wall bisynthesis [Aquimarina amphilecti]|uniref:Glycosyltransferase involved in cell wall bisynthesis n=1 Tax=Aquimarina amphilecti TaxID=1038014 RepID=A0A1H7WII6_AQUAM|nr:glycosyltransferase family 2 protein [Aquimarina amphilecti]SEM20849.1 Glycosyltransferase involved in cell wall bisynthesis [Aquimarina amphilecti]
MLNNKTIAVVVPCYNESQQIMMVLDSMPSFVDRIIVVDDASKDDTVGTVMKHLTNNSSTFKLTSNLKSEITPNIYNRADIEVRQKSIDEIQKFTPSEIINKNPDEEKIIVIKHLTNGGVGAAIATGYKWCKDHDIDCTAVMAGDGQMDPDELESICKPVVEEDIDYVKGNRLIHKSAWVIIPRVRFLGNSILSILTKVASGYWGVSDTQSGYTAISNNALNSVPLYDIYKRYGMPNDLLVKLNIAFCTIREVKIKPIYGVGEKSKLNIIKVSLPILFLLIRCFFKRLQTKYLYRSFHPLYLLYWVAFIIGIINSYFLYQLIANFFIPNSKTPTDYLIIFIFLTISGFQSLLFAMWMDIQDNERLAK